MPVDQDRERCLGRGFVARSRNRVQQFTVGQTAKRTLLEERFKRRVEIGKCFGRHRVASQKLGSTACSFPSSDRLLQLSPFFHRSVCSGIVEQDSNLVTFDHRKRNDKI